MLAGTEDETQVIALTREEDATTGTIEKKSSRSRRQRVTHLGPESAALPIMTTMAPTDDMDMTEESLGDRLKELHVQAGTDSSNPDQPQKNNAKRNAGGGLQASSLEKTLSQALQTGDKQLLETCLGVRDIPVIEQTVRRLENQHVLPLVKAIVQRFQASPNRALILTRWLRIVLTTHMAYLLTLPNLIETLQTLYNVVDTRVAVFDQMLQLSGRLDLILAQVGALLRS